MTLAALPGAGARLCLPRDAHIAYVLGRFAASTIEPLWPLHFGSYHTGRRRIAQLVKLNLVRGFRRRSPSDPTWYSLTRRGLEWVLDEIGCPPEELHLLASIQRVNLAALAERNHLWSSLIRSSRESTVARLALFRPERELRRLALRAVPPIPVVPDALFCLEARSLAGDSAAPLANPSAVCFMVELDSGSERSATWRAKARSYRSVGTLYGAEEWLLLVTVPSARRARTIAEAVTGEGLGPVTFLAVAERLFQGRAFESVLWRADELVAAPMAPPRWSVLDPLSTRHIDQPGGAAADRGSNKQPATENRP